jgi:hypothetical protein
MLRTKRVSQKNKNARYLNRYSLSDNSFELFTNRIQVYLAIIKTEDAFSEEV